MSNLGINREREGEKEITKTTGVENEQKWRVVSEKERREEEELAVRGSICHGRGGISIASNVAIHVGC